MNEKQKEYLRINEKLSSMRELCSMREMELIEERDALKAQVNELRDALSNAVLDISDWGAYASDYFKEKHNLQGVIKDYESLVNKTPEASLSTHNKKIRDEAIAGITQEVRVMEVGEEADEYERGYANCQQAVLNMLEPWPDKGDNHE